MSQKIIKNRFNPFFGVYLFMLSVNLHISLILDKLLITFNLLFILTFFLKCPQNVRILCDDLFVLYTLSSSSAKKH